MVDPPDFQYVKPPAYVTALKLDAMYCHAARKCCDKARKAEPKVQHALKHFKRLEDQSRRILAKYEGDAYKAYDKLEPIYIQMQGASERIAFAYSPLLEGVACTHILCTAALEGHINSRADELLTGKLHRKFEAIDLEFKWLLLPRLVGKSGFDPGAQPFQGFSRLVKFRNALVHYT
jgi:hypothetical protein